MVAHEPGQIEHASVNVFSLESLIINDLKITAETVPRQQWVCSQPFTDGGVESRAALLRRVVITLERYLMGICCPDAESRVFVRLSVPHTVSAGTYLEPNPTSPGARSSSINCPARKTVIT